MITLRCGDWTAGIGPEHGGAIATLAQGGTDVLRPTPSGARDPLAFACLPLVPYANRVAGGLFAFDGQDVSLPVTPAFAPHALHGDGWVSAWHVEAQTAFEVTLVLNGGGDHWPWRYQARQTLTLSDLGLRATLTLLNLDDRRMPAGLGFHPYFPRNADSRLDAPTKGVWTGSDIVPDRLAESVDVFDWQDRRLADAPLVDHAYEGWNGQARLSDAIGVTTLCATTDRLHVFAPPGERFFCLEPITHRPDAFNQARPGDQGFVVLAPGETLSLAMTIERR